MIHVSRPNPYSAPGSCVLLPGRMRDDRGFIDTQTQLDGINGPLNIVLSAEGIRQAARRYPQLGLVDIEDATKALDEAEAARERIAELEAQLAEAQATLESISGLKKAGFQVAKIKGPRPKQEA